jgi:hypothetical protein
VGWIEAPATASVRPVLRVAVRHRKPNGQFGIEVLITTAPLAELFRWTGTPSGPLGEPPAELLAVTHRSDQRGGGCETSFREDQQGLGLGQRNQKRFAGQQRLLALGALAHNLLVWAKEGRLPTAPRLEQYGVERRVREVLGILGRVEWEPRQGVRRILLTEANPLSRPLLPGLQQRVAALGVVVALGPP